jgi:hypothetical protein
VADSAEPFFQRTPVVVLGLDVALQRGDAVYVFSLLAAKEDFDGAERDFLRFADSARIGQPASERFDVRMTPDSCMAASLKGRST